MVTQLIFCSRSLFKLGYNSRWFLCNVNVRIYVCTYNGTSDQASMLYCSCCFSGLVCWRYHCCWVCFCIVGLVESSCFYWAHFWVRIFSIHLNFFWLLNQSTFHKLNYLFVNTDIIVTVQDHQHLSATLGSHSFAEQCVSKKVTIWVGEISVLSQISKSHSHVAYCALTHGLVGHWTYMLGVQFLT